MATTEGLNNPIYLDHLAQGVATHPSWVLVSVIRIHVTKYGT